MAIECFEIRWTKPFPLEEVTKQSEVNEEGVYVRSKISRGKMMPTYLGKSTDFRERSKPHKLYTAYSGADMSKQYISLGTIYSFEKTQMVLGCSSSQLAHIENYLRNEADLKGNDPSTKKGYSGPPIIIINNGRVPKPLRKIMSHNDPLVKLLTATIKPKRKSSASSWPF